MIILRKSKKLWEMYPIGPIKGALNSKRTPHFIGTFKLKKMKMENSVLVGS